MMGLGYGYGFGLLQMIIWLMTLAVIVAGAVWLVRTGALYASVASGDVEMGLNQISEVLAQPSVEFAGPLPTEIQNYTQFAPGIVIGSSQTDGARALVTFLTSPAAQTVLKAKGFE